MRYIELKNKQSKEYDDFSKREDVVMFAAFSNEQFDEAIEKYNIKDYAREIISMGSGMFLARKNVEELKQLSKKWKDELKEARKNKDFAIDMFLYELANHEFGYTGDVEETLDALGIDDEVLEQEPKLKKWLNNAIKRYYMREYEG